MLGIQNNPMGIKMTFDYNIDHSTLSGTTTVSTPTRVKRFVYSDGNLVSEIDGYGTPTEAVTSFTYDLLVNAIESVTDPLGSNTIFQYDINGNRISMTDPVGRTTSWTYNQFNDITSVTPPATYGGAKAATQYTYDESAYSSGGFGNLTSLSRPILSSTGANLGTQVTHYRRSASHPDDVLERIDSAGNIWTYTYDSYGNQLSETAPATTNNSEGSGARNNVKKWAYNVQTGWMIAELSGRFTLANPTANTCTPPAAGCSTFTYDSAGRLLVSTDGNGNKTTNHFTAEGVRDYQLDQKNNKTSFTYDLLGRMLTTTRPDGTVLKTSYWPDGMIKDQTDANGAVTKYSYDGFGHLTEVIDPNNRKTTFQFDLVGNLLAKGKPGVAGCSSTSTTIGCTTYTYNRAKELTAIRYNDPASTPDVSSISYDANGRRTSMSDGSGTSTWTYDSLDQITSTKNGAGTVVEFGYDLRGSNTTITYPAGTVTRTFDPAGRMSTVTDWLSNQTTYLYDADGNLAKKTSPTTSSSIVDSSVFDSAGNISSVTSSLGTTALSSFTYGRDVAGQVNQVTSVGVPTDDHTYGYSPLDQLSIDNSSPITYDAADNLIQIADGTRQSFDSANQLCWSGPTAGTSCATPTSGATVYGYDNRGNRTSKTSPDNLNSERYSYDQADRLSGVTKVPVQGAISAGGAFSMANRTDGTVWTWGANASGQLGNNTTISSKDPVQVVGLDKVKMVASGNVHALALRTDGTVWTWGSNSSGQLGNNTTTNSKVPVQVNGLSGIVAISAGASHSIAVKSDGTVWTWGLNTSGQLGNNTTTNSMVPVQASGLTAVKRVAGGSGHSIAVKSDGTVWTWGLNTSGQLGNNTTTNSKVPVKVSGLTAVTSAAGGSGHSIAVKSDGTVWAWGANASGQLGDATTTGRKIPVQTSSQTGVASVAAGGDHSLSATRDSIAWVWV